MSTAATADSFFSAAEWVLNSKWPRYCTWINHSKGHPWMNFGLSKALSTRERSSFSIRYALGLVQSRELFVSIRNNCNTHSRPVGGDVTQPLKYNKAEKTKWSMHMRVKPVQTKWQTEERAACDACWSPCPLASAAQCRSPWLLLVVLV